MLRPTETENTSYSPYLSFVENTEKPKVKKTNGKNTVLKQNQETEDFSKPFESYIGEANQKMK
jgi:hypothetical protein